MFLVVCVKIAVIICIDEQGHIQNLYLLKKKALKYDIDILVKLRNEYPRRAMLFDASYFLDGCVFVFPMLKSS